MKCAFKKITSKSASKKLTRCRLTEPLLLGVILNRSNERMLDPFKSGAANRLNPTIKSGLTSPHARALLIAILSFLALTSIFGPRWHLQSFFDDSSWLIAELQARGAWSLLTSDLREERAAGLILPLSVFSWLAGDQPIHWMIAQLLVHVFIGYLFMRLLLRQNVPESLAWVGGLGWCFSPALIDAYLWPISLQHQLVLVAGFVLVEQAEIANRVRRRGFLLNFLWMLPLRPSVLIFAWAVLPLVLWSSGRRGLARWFLWLGALTLGQSAMATAFDAGWQVRTSLGSHARLGTFVMMSAGGLALLAAVLFHSKFGPSARSVFGKLAQAPVLRVIALLALIGSSTFTQVGILQLAELSLLSSMGELAPPSVDFSRWQMIFTHPQLSFITPELTWSLVALTAASLLVVTSRSASLPSGENPSAKAHALGIARLWPWILSAGAMSFYLTRMALDPKSAIPQTEPLGVPSRYLMYVMPLALLILILTLHALLNRLQHALERVERLKTSSWSLQRALSSGLAFGLGICFILPWGLEPLRARARDTLFLDAFSSFPLEYALLSEVESAAWPKPDWSTRSDQQPFSARAIPQTQRHWKSATHEASRTLGLPIAWQMLGTQTQEILSYPERLGLRDFAELFRRLYPLHKHPPDSMSYEGRQSLRYQIQLQLGREFALRLSEVGLDCSIDESMKNGKAGQLDSTDAAEICAYRKALQPLLDVETPIPEVESSETNSRKTTPSPAEAP